MGFPNSPRIDGVELVLVGAEAILYGMFLVLFLNGVRVLVDRRKRNHDQNTSPLLLTAFLLFAVTTAHWVLDFSRVYDGFIHAQDQAIVDGFPPEFPNAATAFFANVGTPKYVAISALYFIETMIGDTFMLYRLFVVWNHSWAILIVPTICELAMFATGCYILFAIKETHGSIYVTARGWITAFFVLTLVANLSCTILIAFKIWHTGRKFIRAGVAGTSKIVHILVESASLYSFVLIITLVGYLAKSNVQFIFMSMINPIIGIIFMMIIVRTGGPSSQPGSSHILSHDDVELNTSMGRLGQRNAQFLTASAYAPTTVSVKITSEVETDKGGMIPQYDERSTSTDKVKLYNM